MDRAYLNTPDEISVTDIELGRTFTIHKDAGLPDVVVYNPWKEARDIVDLGDEEYRKMVCVEAAAVGSEITLNPGEEWTATQFADSVSKLCFYLIHTCSYYILVIDVLQSCIEE
ncbi:hypothetical protein ABFS82_11G024500 [Erythranthe guttata]